MEDKNKQDQLMRFTIDNTKAQDDNYFATQLKENIEKLKHLNSVYTVSNAGGDFE